MSREVHLYIDSLSAFLIESECLGSFIGEVSKNFKMMMYTVGKVNSLRESSIRTSIIASPRVVFFSKVWYLSSIDESACCLCITCEGN